MKNEKKSGYNEDDMAKYAKCVNELAYFIYMDEQEKTVARNENPAPWEDEPRKSGNEV